MKNLHKQTFPVEWFEDSEEVWRFWTDLKIPKRRFARGIRVTLSSSECWENEDFLKILPVQFEWAISPNEEIGRLIWLYYTFDFRIYVNKLEGREGENWLEIAAQMTT